MGKWSQYKKIYRKEWELDPELKKWIAPVRTDDSKAACKYCHVEIRAHYNDLKQHAATTKHRSRCNAASTSVASFVQPIPSISNDQKRREIRFAIQTACCTSINNIDGYGDILKDEFPAFRMHRTKCTALINSLLGPYFKEELLKDIGTSPFSLLIDESTDIEVKKLLCICIKYFSTKLNKFVSTFLAMVELDQACSEDIANAVLNMLETCNLDIKNLIGIGTDGASVMCGKHHSTFTLLRDKQPSLQLVRCICHSLDIIAKKAIRSIPSNIEFMIRETYNWFSHSPKRQADYKELYLTLDGGMPLKLISPCETRWLVMADCVDRLLEQYDALKLHFCTASYVEHCYAARMLQEMYQDEINLLYLTFLKPMLQQIKVVNKIFQLESGDTLHIFRDLYTLYLSTLKRILKPSVFTANNQEQLQSLDLQSSAIYLSLDDVDLGLAFRNMLDKSKLPSVSKEAIVTRCLEFMKVLVSEYKVRLPESLSMLRKLESLSPQKVLADPKPPVTDLPQAFFTCPLEVLESQWRTISSCSFHNTSNIESFWMEVYNYTDAAGSHCFHELAMGAIKMLTLPISNAHVERVFSQMTLLKNDRRNRMGLKLLSSILYIKFGLKRIAIKSSSFLPPPQLFAQFNRTMYD
ncbi:uncharacterized protein LOC144828067 [Lissotriton helveticus]